MSNVANFDTWTSFIIVLLIFNGLYALVILMIWKWDKILDVFTKKVENKEAR